MGEGMARSCDAMFRENCGCFTSAPVRGNVRRPPNERRAEVLDSAGAARAGPAPAGLGPGGDAVDRSSPYKRFAWLRRITCAVTSGAAHFTVVIATKSLRQTYDARCAMKRTLLSKIVRDKHLGRRLCLAAAAPLLLVGCTAVVEPVPVTTTEVATTRYGSAVVVERRPPALRVETHTASPGDRYVWVRGHWRWTGVDYDWVPGRWVVRPRPTAVWVEGRWVRRPGGWVWYEGYWR